MALSSFNAAFVWDSEEGGSQKSTPTAQQLFRGLRHAERASVMAGGLHAMLACSGESQLKARANVGVLVESCLGTASSP